MRRKTQFAAGLLASMLLGTASSHAGQISINGLAIGSAGGYGSIPVESFQGRKFSTTFKQQYDFSCGSAALATLLVYTYHQPATKSSVFIDMYTNGEQQAIRQSGFSLLDMKEYLSRHGIPSGGFRAPLEKIAEVRIPAIVLINSVGTSTLSCCGVSRMGKSCFSTLPSECAQNPYANSRSNGRGYFLSSSLICPRHASVSTTTRIGPESQVLRSI